MPQIMQPRQNQQDQSLLPTSQQSQKPQQQETQTPTPQATTNTPAKALGSNSQDVKAARLARATDPKILDPGIFKDPTDRQAATLARAQRILANKNFQALPQDKKDAVLKNYYNQSVVPTYKESGYAIPDETKWVGGIQDKNLKVSPADYYNNSADSFANHLRRIDASTISSAADLFNHVTVAGINIGEKAAKQYLHLDKFYQDHNFHNAPFSSELAETLKKDINHTSSQVTDAMGFWMDTHPSKSWTQHVDTFVGESLVQLPFYEAVGLPLKAAGMLAESAKPIANLTKVLTATPKGQFIARRLTNASEALIAGVMQGQDSKDISFNMLAFMRLGTAGEATVAFTKGAINTARAGASLIKWFTARVLAQGGTPLQEAITRHAAHEMEHGIESEASSLAEHIQGDEVKEKMNMAEKVTLTSLGMQKYDKPWNQLSQAQRRVIKGMRDNLTAEAIKELPIHNEDLAKAHTEAQVKADEKENPELVQKNAEFEKKFGVKISDALHESEMDYTKKATGSDNILSAAKSTSKTAAAQEEKSFKTRSEKLEQEPRKYVSFKTDSLAYFKNIKSSFDKSKNPVNWAKDLEDLSDEDFISELKDHAPGLKFEDDKHALLWAYNFKSNLPKPFLDKLGELLQDKVGNDEQVWAKEGKNLEAHMENLAYTGQLFSEGNVFRSTDTSGSPTKWQKQHSREYQKQELEDYLYTMRPLMKNQKQAVTQGANFLREMQKLRTQAIKDNAPERRLAFNKDIRDFAKTKYNELKSLGAR